jgi:hypothetical protein
MDERAVAKLCGYEAGCAKRRPELQHNATLPAEVGWITPTMTLHQVSYVIFLPRKCVWVESC